jgi:hypothetical protein
MNLMTMHHQDDSNPNEPPAKHLSKHSGGLVEYLHLMQGNPKYRQVRMMKECMDGINAFFLFLI